MTTFKWKRQTREAEYLEDDVLAPVVPGWDRRRLKEVSQHVSRLMANGSEEFDRWLGEFPGGGQLGDQRGQRRSKRAFRSLSLRILRSVFRS